MEQRLPSNDLHITDLIVPKQKLTSGSVEMDDMWVVENTRGNIRHGHIHSHANMGAFWSTIDHTLMDAYTHATGWCLFLVENKKHEYKITLQVKNQAPLNGVAPRFYILEIPTYTVPLPPLSEAELEEMTTLYADRCQEVTYANTFPDYETWDGRTWQPNTESPSLSRQLTTGILAKWEKEEEEKAQKRLAELEKIMDDLETKLEQGDGTDFLEKYQAAQAEYNEIDAGRVRGTIIPAA